MDKFCYFLTISQVLLCSRFVLVVEKDATFQRLLDDGVCSAIGPCVVITGKGVPDLNTRQLVRRYIASANTKNKYLTRFTNLGYGMNFRSRYSPSWTQIRGDTKLC